MYLVHRRINEGPANFLVLEILKVYTCNKMIIIVIFCRDLCFEFGFVFNNVSTTVVVL